MRPDHRARLRLWTRRLFVPALVLLFLLLHIENWSRDFVSYSAETGDASSASAPASIVSDRPPEHLVEAAKWAAFRIRGWTWVGTSAQGSDTQVSFVRRMRMLGIEDDVTVRIQDLGDRRVVTASSRSRTALGDLGRNPRNLRKLFVEMELVLGNAARVPAPFRAEAG